MARYIKKGMSEAESLATEAKVRKTVEDILDAVRQRGDEAVRELSAKFDRWSPADFKLSQVQIDEVIGTLAEQTIADL